MKSIITKKVIVLSSSNIDKILEGDMMNLSAKNEVNPTNGLGGVRAQTDTHTQYLSVI